MCRSGLALTTHETPANGEEETGRGSSDQGGGVNSDEEQNYGAKSRRYMPVLNDDLAILGI